MARDKLKKKIVTYKEGVTLRKQQIEQAKLAIAKEEEELSKLKSEEKILKGLVQQLKGMLLSLLFPIIAYCAFIQLNSVIIVMITIQFMSQLFVLEYINSLPAFYMYFKIPIKYI